MREPSDVQRRGRTIGTSTGACMVAVLTQTRLAVTCAITLTLPGGSLAVQGAGDEDPAVGPGTTNGPLPVAGRRPFGCSAQR